MERTAVVVVVGHRACLAVEVDAVEGHLTIEFVTIAISDAGVQHHVVVEGEGHDGIVAFRNLGEGQRVVVMQLVFIGRAIPHLGSPHAPRLTSGDVADGIGMFEHIRAVRSVRIGNDLEEVRAALGGVHGEQAVDLFGVFPLGVGVDVEVDSTVKASGSDGEGILCLFGHAEVAVVVEEVDQDHLDVFFTIVVELEVIGLHPSAVGAGDVEDVDQFLSVFTHAIGGQGVEAFLVGGLFRLVAALGGEGEVVQIEVPLVVGGVLDSHILSTCREGFIVGSPRRAIARNLIAKRESIHVIGGGGITHMERLRVRRTT